MIVSKWCLKMVSSCLSNNLKHSLVIDNIKKQIKAQTISNKRLMSRLIIVIMQQNEYPFGECDNSMLEKKKIMVRKRIQFHPFQKKNILLKAKKIKGFINPYIIKLQQLLEEDTSIHLLFEYVPIKIQTWISNINPEFIQNFKLQLLQLANYLAHNSILIDFKLKNIGMDQNYLPKYFIGLDYQINTMGKDPLLEKYKKQINQIINPYRAHVLDDKKIQSTREPNPSISKINQTLKRQNQKSAKEIFIPKTPTRSSQAKNTNTYQKDSMKKGSNLIQNDLKLTFDGSHKVLFENLPKNISTNIKIQNIGRKINDLKNMIQNISGKNMSRKHDSVSLSPIKGLNEERPNSSYQKFLLAKKMSQSGYKGTKIQKSAQTGPEVEKMDSKELRQTQSQSEYSGTFPNYQGLDRLNEKMQINEVRNKNEVRVIGGGKKSYNYEFQSLLDDDIDQFAAREVSFETKEDTGLATQEQKAPRQLQNKTPIFGLHSCPLQYQNIKTQPQRFSYSHTTKKRKKSSESASSSTSEIQERVNAVIGASRKLINNFRKTKAGEKSQFVARLQ